MFKTLFFVFVVFFSVIYSRERPQIDHVTFGLRPFSERKIDENFSFRLYRNTVSNVYACFLLRKNNDGYKVIKSVVSYGLAKDIFPKLKKVSRSRFIVPES